MGTKGAEVTRNPLQQLASLGEEVLGKAAQNPAANRMIQGVKDRVDELSKQVRGLQGLEQRLDELERRVDKLESKGSRKSSEAAAKPQGDAAKA
jgi:polyhydroxyalkanoate synthesis regulator phasin